MRKGRTVVTLAYSLDAACRARMVEKLYTGATRRTVATLMGGYRGTASGAPGTMRATSTERQAAWPLEGSHSLARPFWPGWAPYPRRGLEPTRRATVLA